MLFGRFDELFKASWKAIVFSIEDAGRLRVRRQASSSSRRAPRSRRSGVVYSRGGAYLLSPHGRKRLDSGGIDAVDCARWGGRVVRGPQGSRNLPRPPPAAAVASIVYPPSLDFPLPLTLLEADHGGACDWGHGGCWGAGARFGWRVSLWAWPSVSQ